MGAALGDQVDHFARARTRASRSRSARVTISNGSHNVPHSAAAATPMMIDTTTQITAAPSATDERQAVAATNLSRLLGALVAVQGEVAGDGAASSSG